MSELITLKATARPRAGKGAARQARRDGNVPAVIYGNHETPETISLEYNALWKQVLRGHFTSTAIELDVEGKKHIVLARDVQVDPVRDTPLHVDFQRVGKDGVIRVSIPMHFINEALSPGLKRGGVLNIVRHDVEVYLPLRQDSALLRDQPGGHGDRPLDPHLRRANCPTAFRPSSRTATSQSRRLPAPSRATTKLPPPRRRRLAQRRPPTPRPRLRLLAPRLLRPPLLAKRLPLARRLRLPRPHLPPSPPRRSKKIQSRRDLPIAPVSTLGSAPGGRLREAESPGANKRVYR